MPANSWATTALRPNPRYVETNSIDASLRAQIQRLTVVVSPCHVVRVLGTYDSAEVLPVRREYPQAAVRCLRSFRTKALGHKIQPSGPYRRRSFPRIQPSGPWARPALP